MRSTGLPKSRRREVARPPLTLGAATKAAQIRYRRCILVFVVLLVIVAGAALAHAETGYEAWLRYAPLENSAQQKYTSLPASVVVLGKSEVLTSAHDELVRGIQGMLGRRLRVDRQIREPAIVLGTFTALSNVAPAVTVKRQLQAGVPGTHAFRVLGWETGVPGTHAFRVLGWETGVPGTHAFRVLGWETDGFWLVARRVSGFRCLLVASNTDRGVLYGTFALLRKIALGEDVTRIDEIQEPHAPVRWVNEWNNLEGTIERGYAGHSIFFAGGAVRDDLTRVGDYGRLLASLGINGCAINNVNADPRVLTADFLPQLARVAAAFRPWGVRLALSVNFGSPKRIGGLDTFDPLDPRVAEWWKRKADEIYSAVPDFAGFVVKADSEGQVGPSTYQRTHADAANVIARALQPHGGLLFYRGFVYERRYDPANPRNERAKAAYDNFHGLDGKFDGNVIIQIKNGPIDFQVREPASPLIGGLEKTNEAIELQITQEYTGQQRHLCYLAPMWKEVLDFDMQVENPPQRHGGTEKIGPSEQGSGFPMTRSPDGPITRFSVSPCLRSRCGRPAPVKDLAAGKLFLRPIGGFVGVSNVGLDQTWLGHPLAMANLYAFGRLAWNPDLSSTQIVDEWTIQTFGSDPLVRQTIVDMQLGSWRTFEDYSMSLGAGSMTNIADGNHYGPGIPGAPPSQGRIGSTSVTLSTSSTPSNSSSSSASTSAPAAIGRDRSVATGTGYAGQYPQAVARVYESVDTTPDELLLFFHRVPYTYVLHSGKTVIQHIYDSHYEGAERVQGYVEQWISLKGRIDNERYAAVLARLEYQAGHARVWRDAICNWFLRLSGIADAKGRVGHHPDRLEAEDMELHGYVPLDVAPPETASGGKAIECLPPAQSCETIFHFQQNPGWYDLDVQYFDQNNGASKFRIFVGKQLVDEWVADDLLPNAKVGGDTSVRRRISGLVLRPGDEIRIEGIPDGGEHAVIDYVELRPRIPLGAIQ